MKAPLAAILLSGAALAASAQTLQGLKVEPALAKVGEEVKVTATFEISQGLNCNVRFEFGDGEQRNVAINQIDDATMVLRHRYAAHGTYTVNVLPRTAMPTLKCLGDDLHATVTVGGGSASAGKAAAPKPSCPAGWTLDAKSVNKKTGAYLCRAKPGTAAPAQRLACPAGLGYYENTGKGLLGCRE
jgi:hypothetical protein